ncbi:hypothetical protein BDW71DRAFT_166655 [Aspergillus fruticulosus]
MCFYQPNPPGCACAFHQLIQPCPNASTYPPPEPTKNPNPLVKVCDVREFAKGVGMRICLGCQPSYAGMNIMGLGGVGLGRGGEVGYASMETKYAGFISQEWHAAQQDEQKTGGLLKENMKAGLTESMMEMMATATAPASISASTSPTGAAFATGTGTGPEDVTTYNSGLMIRRRGPKTESRRVVPYPNSISKRRMAVSSPVPEPTTEAAKGILTPMPTPSDLGNGTDKGESQEQRHQRRQVRGCGRTLSELEEDPDSRLPLLRYDPVFAATVSSLPGVERKTTAATTSEAMAEIRDESRNGDAEKNKEEASDLPRIEEAHALKADNENQVGMVVGMEVWATGLSA